MTQLVPDGVPSGPDPLTHPTSGRRVPCCDGDTEPVYFVAHPDDPEQRYAKVVGEPRWEDLREVAPADLPAMASDAYAV